MLLCFSPIGDPIRVRCRRFPALVNCVVIDWFQPWPEEALQAAYLPLVVVVVGAAGCLLTTSSSSSSSRRCRPPTYHYLLRITATDDYYYLSRLTTTHCYSLLLTLLTTTHSTHYYSLYSPLLTLLTATHSTHYYSLLLTTTLQAVSLRFLKGEELGTAEAKASVINFMPYSFVAVEKLSLRYQQDERRYNYSTPESFP